MKHLPNIDEDENNIRYRSSVNNRGINGPSVTERRIVGTTLMSHMMFHRCRLIENCLHYSHLLLSPLWHQTLTTQYFLWGRASIASINRITTDTTNSKIGSVLWAHLGSSRLPLLIRGWEYKGLATSMEDGRNSPVFILHKPQSVGVNDLLDTIRSWRIELWWQDKEVYSY